MKLVSMCQFPLFQVGLREIPEHKTLSDSRQLSTLPIVTTLESRHFNNGQLIIKCTAYISKLYRNTSELHLMPRNTDPIPERGRFTIQVNKLTNNSAGNISSLFGLHSCSCVQDVPRYIMDISRYYYIYIFNSKCTVRHPSSRL
jgi:hypothetical protein